MINCASAQIYFAQADRRVLIGLRATLELLGIPVPEYAVRKPAGRPPARAVAAAFNADHPTPWKPKPAWSDPLGERRMSAAITKGLAKAAKRKAGGLFDETFNG